MKLQGLQALEMDYYRSSCGLGKCKTLRNQRIRNKSRTILDKVNKKQVIWYGHIIKRMGEERWPKQVLLWPPTGRMRIGRPRPRWKQYVEEAIATRGIGDHLWRSWKLSARKQLVYFFISHFKSHIISQGSTGGTVAAHPSG